MNRDIYNWLETAGSTQGDRAKVSMAVSLIEEELQELKEAIEKDDVEEICDALEDLKWVCGNVAYYYGIPVKKLEEYQRLVSTSNWSKFCASQEDAIWTVKLYMEGTHPSKPGEKILCYYHPQGEYWIVRRGSDNKIMKNAFYKPVKELQNA